MSRPNLFEAWSAESTRLIWRDDIWRGAELSRPYPVPIDRLWHAWTDPKELARWLAPVSGEFSVDGVVIIDVGMAATTAARVLQCEPPHRLATTWVHGDDPTDPPGEVELNLTVMGGGSHLRLAHRSVDDRDWPAAVGTAWEVWLRRLDDYLRGTDPDAVSWDAIAPTLEPLWATAERELINRRQ